MSGASRQRETLNSHKSTGQTGPEVLHSGPSFGAGRGSRYKGTVRVSCPRTGMVDLPSCQPLAGRAVDSPK